MVTIADASRYTSRRSSIAKALVAQIKTISIANGYLCDLYENADTRLIFWDEVQQYPAVYLNLGTERRTYQGGGYKDRFLAITIRCYVQDENSQDALEMLLEDLETVIEQNGRLAYQDSSGATQMTQDIIILSIDTDEGALAPLGVADILLQVRY